LNVRLTNPGDSLREMDIELMRRLSPRVNVIPVIGKADSLTPSELRGFKKRVSIMSVDQEFVTDNSTQIMEDIEHYDIPVYNFPYDVEEDDEETIQDNSELRVCKITSHILSPITLTFR
jgi:cell division control protein 11